MNLTYGANARIRYDRKLKFTRYHVTQFHYDNDADVYNAASHTLECLVSNYYESGLSTEMKVRNNQVKHKNNLGDIIK